MTFKEWWEQRFTKEMTPIKYALVKDVQEAWAEARLEEAKAWHHIVTQDTYGISLSLYQWATDRLREAKELAAPPASGEAEGKCGKSAGILIAGVSSYACVLPKDHQPSTHPDAIDGHLRGGRCFKHGEYIGKQCPQWPGCIDPMHTGQAEGNEK